MSYLFTSESVSEGHPDKVADQISDAVLDEILSQDQKSKCACETFVTTGLVVIGGEVSTHAYVDVQEIARKVIKQIGYVKSSYKFEAESCGVMNTLHEQSPDIRQGVDREKEEEQGAGDQGMMFGYAINETENFMPLTIDLSHRILEVLADVRKEGKEMTYLGPDSKAQVTVEYSEEGKPLRIDTIVVSTQHDEFVMPTENTPAAQKKAENDMLERIRADVINILMPRVKALYPPGIQEMFGEDIKYFVNPTGKFVIGGPHGDTGLTGRKIIVDTYGGRGAHGGGAFSGKDASKVDRSAAYAARYIAKNLVAAGVADEVGIQLAYAIGVASPVSVLVDTNGTSKVGHDSIIAEKVKELFDLRPYAYIKKLGLRNPIFQETAAYGHMGRVPGKKEVIIEGKPRSVETFTWEKLDAVDDIKKTFGIS
jgi:S-adenosylmethionine synthetase